MSENKTQETFVLDHYVLHHVENAQEWHIPFLPSIALPEGFSLHALMLYFSFFLCVFLFGFLYNKKARFPTGITNLLEVFILFIRDEICVPCLGKEDGRKMTPLFCTFFFLILFMNLMGMIPLFSTATANYNVTGALALVTFSFMIFGCIYKNGLKGFFHAIKPFGVPVPILFIIIPIEILGLFIKSFVLMIRLFANLLGGHIVILSLTGLIVLLGLYTWPVLFPIILFITLLEIFVAFLQSYIFTMLSAMFIGQMYHPHH